MVLLSQKLQNKKDRKSLWEAVSGKIGNTEENSQGSAMDNFDLRQFSMMKMSLFMNSKLV